MNVIERGIKQKTQEAPPKGPESDKAREDYLNFLFPGLDKEIKEVESERLKRVSRIDEVMAILSVSRSNGAYLKPDQVQKLKEAIDTLRQQLLSEKEGPLIGPILKTSEEEVETNGAERTAAEAPVREEKPPDTIDDLKVKPYSGVLIRGDSVTYRGEKSWQIIGYDLGNGNAIIGLPGNAVLKVITQEELYAENRGLAETLEPDRSLDKTKEQPAASTVQETRPAGLESDLDLPLEEIEKKIRFAEGTFRTPGVTPDGLSYWENIRDQKLKREQALKNEEERQSIGSLVARINGRLRQLNIDYDQIRDDQPGAEKSKRDILDKIEFLKKERRKLEKKAAKLEKGAGPGFKAKVKEVYYKSKAKAKTAWSWLKERVRGAVTFGYREFRQAERLRRGAKKTSNELDIGSSRIRQEKNLTQEEALEEASRIQDFLAQEGVINPTAQDYEALSGAVSQEKLKANNKFIDELVPKIMADLTDRVASYSGQASGEKVVFDPEKRKAVEQRLRDELNNLRDGEIRSDFKKYRQIILKNLDPKWWFRYIYGSVELALAALGAYWLAKDIINPAASVSAASPPPLAGSPPPPDLLLETGLKDTVWQESARMLNSQGITSPSDGMIQEVSKAIAKQNGIGVKVWGLDGSPFDVVMQKGHLLKLSDGWEVVKGFIK